jgi:RNA polymerase sporulation-specific sigma factor
MFISYIASSTSFPKPLKPEDEEEYLKRYEQGDEEAKNILVERNLRLVAHIVKKYHNTGREVDDLISIGTIGLIKAITSFDRNKGTRLATYAARCIEKPMLTKMRYQYEKKFQIPFFSI